MSSAPTESRTRTPSRALESKSSVSAYSTMSARKIENRVYLFLAT